MSRGAKLCRHLLLVAAVSTACACAREGIQLPPVARTDLPRQLESTGPPVLDVSNGRSRTIFWLLGFRDEYQGRQIAGADDDRVEGFYCDEAEAVRDFRRVLSRLAREQGFHEDVKERVYQQCLTELRSLEIRVALDSFYVDRRTTGIFANGKEVIALRATYDMFDGMGPGAKLAYLSGAYQRHGRGSAFGSTNAEHKADLIARLLSEVGATDVRRVTARDSIPNGNWVHFRASSELAAALERDEPW